MDNPATQLATVASSGVGAVASPLVALGVALLLLTIVTGVIWFLISSTRQKD